MLAFVKKLVTGRGYRNVEERLRAYLSVSDTIIAIGFFSFIFNRKLQLEHYFGTNDPLELASRSLEGDLSARLLQFVDERGLFALLAAFTFLWYFLYKRAVRNELDIFVRLCSRLNPPHNWQGLAGQRTFPILAIILPLTFIVLAWFIDRVPIYCVILLVMNIIDLRGNTVVRQNFTQFFGDPRYVPPDSDVHKPFIMRRRAIAEAYWIRKPQLERIGLMMIGAMAAFLMAFSEQIAGVAIWPGFSYLAIIATISANEWVIAGWRRARDRSIEAVDRDEERADRERTGETEPETVPT